MAFYRQGGVLLRGSEKGADSRLSPETFISQARVLSVVSSQPNVRLVKFSRPVEWGSLSEQFIAKSQLVRLLPRKKGLFFLFNKFTSCAQMLTSEVIPFSKVLCAFARSFQLLLCWHPHMATGLRDSFTRFLSPQFLLPYEILRIMVIIRQR